MSSPKVESAACLQITDAGNSTSISVLGASAGSETLSDAMAGKIVRMYSTGGIAYLSGGKDATDPTSANGFEIADGEFQDVFIPHKGFVLKHRGSADLTLKLVITSS